MKPNKNKSNILTNVTFNPEIPYHIPNESFNSYDSVLLISVLFLVGIGTIMVYSASSAMALKLYGTGYYFLKKQFISALVGCIALVICRNVPYLTYKYLAYPGLAFALISLAVLFIPGWGFTAGGATRWIRVMGISFQPSEFTKFALIVYLAYSMSKKREKIKQFSIGFLPHAFVVSLYMMLIAIQPDFGSVVIIAVLTLMLLFAGGVRLIHLFSCGVAMLPTVYYLIVNAPYRLRRIMSFLDPWEYQTDSGYQIIHSLMAFGSGGIMGAGLGKGYQKLFYLPEPHTDFIFSVVGEELGLIGILIILILFSLVVYRGFVLTMTTEDMFGSYLALGITMAIALQVCINISVTLGLLPTKGLTLPFLSYGGTSLVMNMAAIGILMNISSYHNN